MTPSRRPHQGDALRAHADRRNADLRRLAALRIHGFPQDRAVRLELLFIVGDPGVRQSMPQILDQIVQRLAVRKARPPQVAEAAGLFHRERKREKPDSFHRVQNAVRVTVLSDECQRQVQVLRWRVIAPDALPAESGLRFPDAFPGFIVQLYGDKQSHTVHRGNASPSPL